MRRSLLAAALILTTLAPFAHAEETTPTRVFGTRAIDVEGQIHLLGSRSANAPVVLVFIGTECPISNRSVPKLNALAADATKAGLEMYGVYSDPFTKQHAARKHTKEYKFTFPMLFDASGILAKRLAPTHVPEAFVIGTNDLLLYRGAIDNEWVQPTKQRKVAKEHYLANAIAAIGAKQPLKTPRTQAVGCLFEGDKKPEKPRAVTYNRDIAPLLAANCVTCHREGEVAPFTLTSYEDAAKRAKFVAQVTREKLMPPWMPAERRGTFLDERHVDEDSMALLEAWAAAGAPRGDAEDLAPSPRFSDGWRFGEPDLVIEMSEAFTVPAGGDDVFRNFVLPLNLAEDKQVVAFEYKPGAPRVVHHALFFLDDHQRGRKLDARSDGPGYPGFGGVGFNPSGALGGFAPGAQPVSLPKGVARYVSKSADVIMQVHYHPSGKEEADQGKIGLYFAETTDNKPLRSLMLGTRGIRIPPGEANYQRAAGMVLPADIEVIGIAPHMHYLGKEMKVWATTPEGREIPLVWIKEWDFNWQGQYFFTTPLKLEKGTRIQMTASYDNSSDNPHNPSDPPRWVTYGEQSFDEMCYCFLTIVTPVRGDIKAIRGAMYRMFMPGELERRAWKMEEEAKKKRKREQRALEAKQKADEAKAKAEAETKAKQAEDKGPRRYF